MRTRWLVAGLVGLVAAVADIYAFGSDAVIRDFIAECNEAPHPKGVSIHDSTNDEKSNFPCDDSVILTISNGAGKGAIYRVLLIGAEDPNGELHSLFEASDKFRLYLLICHRSQYGLSPTAKSVRRCLPGVAENYFVTWRGRPTFIYAKMWINRNVSSQLPFSAVSGYSNAVFGGIAGPSGFFDSSSSGVQSSFQQPNRPATQQQGANGHERHNPLRQRVLDGEPSLPAAEALIRISAFLSVGVFIMIQAGRFSGRDFGRSAWRFYGGLAGGLALSVLVGFLLLGWPVLRAYGVLP